MWCKLWGGVLVTPSYQSTTELPLVTPLCQRIPESPRSRSARNVTVLGSKKPRQVLTFLNGLLRESSDAMAGYGSAERLHQSEYVIFYASYTSYVVCAKAKLWCKVAFCHVQPPWEGHVCADRIKTPALGEVLSSLVPLRFYPSESASAQTCPSHGGVPCRKPLFTPIKLLHGT